jgi:ATP-dependent Clp protease ATP-binding subunit ClpA
MTHETPIEPALEAKLRRLRLRVERTADDTLVVKGVPLDRLRFSKGRTNLLVKRVAEGLPCAVCVDDDLEYTGAADPALASAFAAARRQQGWRILAFGGRLSDDPEAALDCALRLLLAEEGPAGGGAAGEAAILAASAEDLAAAQAAGQRAVTIGRGESLEQACACLLRREPWALVVAGEAGVGKTNFLYGVQRLLGPRGVRLMRVDMGVFTAATLLESEREALLMKLLKAARAPGIVLALESAEWAVHGLPRGAVLLLEALERGVRLIFTATPEHAAQLAVEPLGARLETVRLGELCASDTCAVLQELRPALAAHHGVAITDDVEQAAVERAQTIPGALPGKAVALLDAAAARAQVTGNAEVHRVDVYLAAARLLAGSAEEGG